MASLPRRNAIALRPLCYLGQSSCQEFELRIVLPGYGEGTISETGKGVAVILYGCLFGALVTCSAGPLQCGRAEHGPVTDYEALTGGLPAQTWSCSASPRPMWSAARLDMHASMSYIFTEFHSGLAWLQGSG